MSWEEVLRYAQSSLGVSAIVGTMIFLLVEYVPGFGGTIEDPKKKRLVVMALSLVVPVLALILEVLTVSHTTLTLPMIWNAIFAGAASFGTSTALHTLVLKNT